MSNPAAQPELDDELAVRFALPSVSLNALAAQVSLRSGASTQLCRLAFRRAGDVWECVTAASGLAATLRVSEHEDGTVLVSLRLKNLSSETINIDRVAPLLADSVDACRIGRDAGQWSIFRQGYQSWTGTRSFRAREIDRDPWPHPIAVSLIDICNRSPGQPGHFRSDMYAAVKNLYSGEVLVAGFVDGATAFAGIEVAVEGDHCRRFAATLDYDGIELPAGGELLCPPLWLAAGRDEHLLIGQYLDAVAAAMHARVPAHNPVGWCSWYYYFTDINEDCISENLQALARLNDRIKFDYFQVDDGYQSEIGDWTTANAKFPRGMGWVAEQIRQAGYDAGIWTAPFIAKPESRLMRDHPHWFVRNEKGKPRFALWNPLWGVRSSCYALDTTHPEVLEWLRQTFRTIAGEWGYRVLKLDFLYAAALPGQRYDPHATRAMALRRGLDAIREAVGDEAFLLGCGCPLGPAIGAVDAMRIGPDVAPWWTNVASRSVQRNMHGLATLHAVRNTLTRAYSHRRLWLNDPDCLMVRDTNTALTEDEVRSLATAIATTDGMIIFSDRIEELSPARLKLLERTLQLAGGRVRVADLMEADVPELVVAHTENHTVVAVFNFADEAQPKRIDLRALEVSGNGIATVQDWWTGVPIAVRDGQADFGTIPAHGCRVAVFES